MPVESAQSDLDVVPDIAEFIVGSWRRGPQDSDRAWRAD